MEETKNISHAKGEGAVDHSMVTGRLKKFHLDCKNLNNWGLSSISNLISSTQSMRWAHHLRVQFGLTPS